MTTESYAAAARLAASASSYNSRTQMIGRTLSHYRVESQLGSGGMGVVYAAEDMLLGRRVALKILPDDLAQDPGALERFRREARAASALNHPGICTIYSIEQDGDSHFITMELLEGETLGTRLARGPIPIEDLLDLGSQIADALESAHAKGIIHRDIKPLNIFINEQGRAKLLDFGLAKIEARRAGASQRPDMPTAVKPDALTRAGTTLGTVAYMSPEQARAEITDARTDIFSLGAVLYEMATGTQPFRGETSAVIFDAILNRDPTPVAQLNAGLPSDLGRVIAKALEKDRTFRHQSATDLKTDLLRVKRDLDSGRRAADEKRKSIAVLYFENPSGAKEDEYLRDGVTEDIISELAKIKELNIFSRATILAYRDRSVTPAAIGRQLNAAFVLTGSLRRSGARLRINTQLVDTRTDFPVWSERYDREMKDMFELQDDIARSIAQALRVTLTPQEQSAIANRPTADTNAYDLYLRGKSYARRVSRQDLEFALQMFEDAVVIDPKFALAHAAIANLCAQFFYHFERDGKWLARASAAAERARALDAGLPETQLAEGWRLHAQGDYDGSVARVRPVIAHHPDTEGAYYLLGRSLFTAGRFQEAVAVAEDGLRAAGDDYNVYVVFTMAAAALGKKEMAQSFRVRSIEVLERNLKQTPEDGRAHSLLASSFAGIGRAEDALREGNIAMALRPNDSIVLYNVACAFAEIGRVREAMNALRRSGECGPLDPAWVRRDPDLQPLHGDEEFERMFPTV